jgi:hypothetical protein
MTWRELRGAAHIRTEAGFMKRLLMLAGSGLRCPKRMALVEGARGSFLRACCATVLLLLLSQGAAAADDAAIEFNRDIRPILSENCYACHGPDARMRKAGLRLDVETDAKTRLESQSIAVVPGKRDQSELWARITAAGLPEQMPPADSGKALTKAQVELLGRWIDQGARWQGHWSFLPISRALPPAVDDPSFARNAIDAFVVARLGAAGLAHAPPADPATLLRRLHFDLVGLPPAPEVVERYAANPSEMAYEQLVDALLASQHFGERMAMFWLDLVRYADSVGYHGDQPVSVSPYRDYVISAFNQNLPFDQFTIEQLAGDLLPNPTRAQKIASGYNRLGMMSAEGGVQDKEYLSKYIAERVRNASGTWLGVTLGCCECHDHKFDPFTMRDFYRFEAFFADIQERGLYSGADQSGAWGPTMMVPTEEQERELARLDGQLALARKQLETSTAALEEAQAAWEASVAPRIDWKPVLPLEVSAAGGAQLALLEDHSILAAGPRSETETYRVKARLPLPVVTAVRVEVLPHETLPKQGPGRAENGNFVLTELTVSVERDGNMAAVPLTRASASFEQKAGAEKNPYKVFTAASAIDADARGPEWGWAILEEAGKPNHAVFETTADLHGAEQAAVEFVLKQNFAGHALGRFRILVTGAARPVAAQGAGLPRAVREILALEAAARTDAQKQELAAFYRGIAPLLAPAREKLAELQKSRDTLARQVRTTLLTVAVAPRMVRVLKRGNWMDESGEVVSPATPELLPRPAPREGRLTRLDLANWLVAKENPLTARVLVNRLWKQYFGAGLSRKLDDLGAQGDWPSHPELLDWLAAQLVDHGWDLKRTIKLIVMSGAYRQSSLAPADVREKDPYNRWLARQGRFRLDAELVRDNALAVSGLLVDQVGGGSVKPYQPPGYWAYLNFPMREWQNGTGPELYRRGLYTHWQRQYLHPSLLAFDAPTREECTADRVRSNTPLQSLVLLNDPSFVEAARAFAERIMREGGATTGDRLDWAYRQALSRAARPRETQVLEALLTRHLAEYREDPAAAGALLSVGARLAAKDLDAAELAAWTSVARLIFNLHEVITRY